MGLLGEDFTEKVVLEQHLAESKALRNTVELEYEELSKVLWKDA